MHEARLLQRNVFIFNRLKTGNETIYYNVDQIHTAILENKQIEYKYAEWTVQKEFVSKKNGALYKVSPWALTWDDENYYLIAYDEVVTLVCRNEIAGVVLDRFGKDITLIPMDEEHFRVRIRVAISSQFFGWVTGIGKGMQIIGPESVKKEYRKYLQDILQEY